MTDTLDFSQTVKNLRERAADPKIWGDKIQKEWTLDWSAADAIEALGAALRQPPQPTGDVGELVEQLRDEHVCDGYTCNWDDVMRQAADMLESLNSMKGRTWSVVTGIKADRIRVAELMSEVRVLTRRAEAAEQALRTAPEPPQNFITLKPVELLDWGISYRHWWVALGARAALTGAGEMEK